MRLKLRTYLIYLARLFQRICMFVQDTYSSKTSKGYFRWYNVKCQATETFLIKTKFLWYLTIKLPLACSKPTQYYRNNTFMALFWHVRLILRKKMLGWKNVFLYQEEASESCFENLDLLKSLKTIFQVVRFKWSCSLTILLKMMSFTSFSFKGFSRRQRAFWFVE